MGVGIAPHAKAGTLPAAAIPHQRQVPLVNL